MRVVMKEEGERKTISQHLDCLSTAGPLSRRGPSCSSSRNRWQSSSRSEESRGNTLVSHSRAGEI